MKKPASLFVAAAFMGSLLPSSTLSWELGSGNRGMWNPNCGYLGQDFRGVGSSSQSCGDICAGDPNCSHWTWYNGNCFLKTGTQHTMTPLEGATCGFIIGRFNQMTPDMLVPTMVTSPLALIQPPSGTWLKGSGGRSAFAYNCDLPFNDIRNFPLANADACGSSCADEPKCSHWTWRNGNCMLKFGTEHQAIASQGTTCGFIFGRFNQMTPDMLVPTMVTSPLALIQPPSGTWLKGSGGRSAFAYNCDLPFNDIRNFPWPMPTHVAAVAPTNPICSHWTWRTATVCSSLYGAPSHCVPRNDVRFIFGRF
ncbi:Scp extracellular protein, partial [Globisporangium splendens]